MKYNYFQDEKLKYEDIEIPDELLLLVRQTVAADRRRKAAVRRNRLLRTAGSIAAVLFLCLTIGVNSSYAFAETAVKIPVVKSIAKSVVVRSYRPEIIAVYEQNKNSKSSEKPEAAPEDEQPPAETVPAVSDNDTVSGDIMQPEPEEQPSETVLEGLDAWKAEMTPEKFREVTERYTPDMEERYADAPEKLRTILLAELPEKEVSLYGYHEDNKITGVALLIEDKVQYFDWNYMNDSRKLPDISAADVNEDGEEELIVLLYNGAPQKKEISKEDIAEPGASEEQDDRAEAAADIKEDKEVKENNKEDSTADETKASGQSETPADNEDNADNAGSEEKTAVSGNDIKPAEPEKESEQPEQKAGEIWVISPEEENWTASMLSVNDYESQILHQLKAEYDEKEKTVQLYLMEEAFGDTIKLQTEGTETLTYESLNVGADRELETEDGLSLRFKLEAVFQTETGEKKTVVLEPEFTAEIRLEGGSLNIENIKK